MSEHLNRSSRPSNRPVLQVERLEERRVLSAAAASAAGQLLFPPEGGELNAAAIYGPHENGVAIGRDSVAKEQNLGQDADHGHAYGLARQGKDGVGTDKDLPVVDRPSPAGKKITADPDPGKKEPGADPGERSVPSIHFTHKEPVPISVKPVEPKDDDPSGNDFQGAIKIEPAPKAETRPANPESSPGDYLPEEASSDSAGPRREVLAADGVTGASAGGQLPDRDDLPTPGNGFDPGRTARVFTPSGARDNFPPTAPPGEWGEEVEEVSAAAPVEDGVAPDEPAPASYLIDDAELADYAAMPSAALDKALEQFLEQVEGLGQEIGKAVQETGIAPWVLAALAAGAAVELSRRRRGQGRLALAGDAAWITGLPGPPTGEEP